MKLLIKSIIVLLFMIYDQRGANGEIPKKTMYLINRANTKGPYLGVIIPNTFELNPLLQSPSFTPSKLTIDFAGKRFRFGTIEGKKVILVMTGLGMVNAGITTQLLLSLFRIEGVVHYGIAGNADPSLHIGDVAIPKYWAHLGLWNWQRYGQGPENELPLEAAGDYSYVKRYGQGPENELPLEAAGDYSYVKRYGQGPENELPLEAAGDYSREYGNLRFGDYTTNTSDNANADNLLNRIWFQAEEVFPIDGIPEERQHIFWVPVHAHYFNIAKQLQGLNLESCVNATKCLTTTPKVTTVERGVSASIYIDNAAYRNFVYEKFNLSPIEMESAGIALICYQQRIPFITIRALSDLAGGGSAESNEADIFISVASKNSVISVVEFIKLLSSSKASN